LFGRYKHRVVFNSLFYVDAKGGWIAKVFYWKVNKCLSLDLTWY